MHEYVWFFTFLADDISDDVPAAGICGLRCASAVTRTHHDPYLPPTPMPTETATMETPVAEMPRFRGIG